MGSRRVGWMITVAIVAATLLATMVGCGGTESQIIGKWQGIDSSETIEFFKDGTLMTGGSPLSMGGVYSFVDQNRIRIEFGGLGALGGPQVFRVELSGDRLTMVRENDPSDVWELVKIGGK